PKPAAELPRSHYRQIPYSHRSVRRPAQPRSPDRPQAIERREAQEGAPPPSQLPEPSSSWPCRRRREGLRVGLDHLLNVGRKAHDDLLTDVDVEVDVDRLVGRLNGDAAIQRNRNGESRRKPRGFC